MKVITIINLKGGVGKTITAINIAHILSQQFGKRILLLDNDKQGNSSHFFGLYDYEKKSMADVMLGSKAEDVIRSTKYKNLDLLPANMALMNANLQVAASFSMKSLRILKEGIEGVRDKYDYAIVDCAPDINASVINALNVTDEAIVPIVVDKFSFDGINQLEDQFKDAKEVNKSFHFAGCLITRYRAKEDAERLAKQNVKKYKIFETKIRRTPKVSESTFDNVPILEYSRRCGASMDYMQFVKSFFKLEG